MANVSFKVYERNTKESKNKLRKAGLIPGIIFGEFLKESIPVKMCNAELHRMIRNNNSGSIITLDLENKKFNCVVKEIQKLSPREILHVSFQSVKANEKIKMRIPIKYIGQENLETKRLVLETFTPFIDFQGDVEKIPEFLEVNVSKMNCEDKLFVEDINVPKDILVTTDPKTLLAVINPCL
ncbi:50S ribosomal protein L25 [Clostridium botulinum]|uniref:50S ribosomal protein L25 n=1 Tax=Clostridium botulinum TaxID=1491 RepID=UPI0005970FEB|nr:50S ribosomal protein L25 [Clostridium botulinum]KIL07438.1 50S ribosomal protein L25 [Clostridium botulinum]MBY6934490.1 50S ribosomal protein L25 [Clostridium botulinum]NFL84945.1 50S ribosomal protein L25 [Clostridium botulinum]NFN13112.1 50S ribosomal protein L25 [Clostridium botulinum]NFO38339.1 50S ribosomal protein L25 [Clostridium botulinum]